MELSYYQKNKELILQRRKESYNKNKEKEKLYAVEYRKKNRVKINHNQRQRYANDPEYQKYKKDQSKLVYSKKKSNP